MPLKTNETINTFVRTWCIVFQTLQLKNKKKVEIEQTYYLRTAKHSILFVN